VYLDLPAEEAQKLRQKFNNTILRGKKMRVEEARADSKKKRRAEEAVGGEADATPASLQKSKKPRPEQGVLHGVELPQGRHVKRGWTQEAQDKHKNKRSYSTKSEKSQMLFRVALPPNVASKLDSKERKQKKPTKTSPTTLEVKEYTKTTKHPTFLRSSAAKREGNGPLSFVDGKGWVDTLGAVIEPVSTKREKSIRSSISAMNSKPNPKSAMIAVGESVVHSEPHDSSSDSESEVSSDSGSDISSSSASTSSDEDASSSKRTPITGAQHDAPHVPSPNVSTLPAAAPTNPLELTREHPDVKQQKEIHPLEALYKRPKNDPSAPRPLTEPETAPIKTVFNFFETEENEAPHEKDSNDAEFAVPQTPFAKRDQESRSMRSAAPTPDTAAPKGRFRAPWSAAEDEEGDDLGGESTMIASSPVKGDAHQPDGQVRPLTAFEQQFWKEQGDYNRSWKARRREAQKEQRHTANKRHNFI